MFCNIVMSRELIWQMFKRDFLAGYKKSFLGISWIIISPVVGIAAWVFMQMTGLLRPGELSIPYPAYVLIGTSMWGLFMGFYQAASQTLSSGSELIMQVHYPHEALLIKQTAQNLAGFVISFALVVVILVFFGVVPSWRIIFLPLIILPLFFLGAAIGLITSMISVVAVDINNAINVVMGMMMWLTPVIYTSNVPSPVVQAIIKWNPLTYLVCSARDIVIYGRLYDAGGYALSAAAAVLVFLVAWRLFYVSENKVVERMI